MAFFRKKKQKRDREAGLVFQWRGGREHHMGKLVALVMAGSLFGFFALNLEVEGLEQPVVSKRTGSVVYLDEADPAVQRLVFQLEDRSPFPARWDPAYDRENRARYTRMLAGATGDAWEYRPALVPPPQATGQLSGLTSVMDTRTGLLSGMADQWTGQQGGDAPLSGDLLVRVELRAGGQLGKRLGIQEWNMPGNLVSEDWFGQSFRFMVGVDQRGVVRSCIPLTGGSMGVVKAGERWEDLAVWLRGQKFTAVHGGKQADVLLMGELELLIHATRE